MKIQSVQNALSSPYIFVWFFLLILPLSVQSANIELSAKERAWIRANPTINVANELDWPPFDFVNNGKPSGYSIDLISKISSEIGLKVNFINGFSWPELLEKFKAKEIDVLPVLYRTQDREAYIAFSDSYVSQPSVIVVHQDEQGIDGLKSLIGKRIAVIADYAVTEELKNNYPDIQLVFVDNVVEALKAVGVGKVDAYIDGIGIISYTIKTNFIPGVKVLDAVDMRSLSNPSLYMGVAKDDPVLLSILNKGISDFSHNGKLELTQRWLKLPEQTSRLTLSPQQLAWVKQHPVIRIGIDEGYAPYSFLDSKGNFVGVAPDLLKLLEKKIGIEFKPVPNLVWSEIVEGARQRTLDVIATAVLTEERRKFLDFTPIYIATPLVIMTRQGQSNIKSADDLGGNTVALVQGYSSSQRVINEHPEIKQFTIPSPLKGLQAVSTGEADAYVGVLGVNTYLMREHGIANLKIAGRYDLETNGQRIGVRSDWPELTLLLTQALDSITETERKRIFDKWISVPEVQAPDYGLIWRVLLVSFAILVLFYVHNRRLSREVKQRQLAEQELIKANETLLEAKDIADRASQAKSEFLSSMSHELRTPMNAILGFGQLLELNIKNPESVEYVQQITGAGQHLLKLIDEVLDLSKIESGGLALNLGEVELNEALGECLSLISPLAKKFEVELRSELGSSYQYIVLADYTRLKQVLLNLLSNAIKYNRRKGVVRIGCEETDGKQLRIFVIDTGVGLSEEQLSNLFKPFERVGAEKTGIEGTGIGLVITKRLLEMMNGSIGVKSAPGEGATFWVDIGLVGVKQGGASQTSAPISPIPKEIIASDAEVKGVILYIEDNPTNLRLVEQVVTKHTPYKLISAHDASIGLALAEVHHPDLILLDINLPGMDGFEAHQKLKENEKTRNIPVIAISANAMEDDIKKGKEAGFNEYLPKPINVVDLLANLDKYLGGE